MSGTTFCTMTIVVPLALVVAISISSASASDKTDASHGSFSLASLTSRLNDVIPVIDASNHYATTSTTGSLGSNTVSTRRSLKNVGGSDNNDLSMGILHSQQILIPGEARLALEVRQHLAQLTSGLHSSTSGSSMRDDSAFVLSQPASEQIMAEAFGNERLLVDVPSWWEDGKPASPEPCPAGFYEDTSSRTCCKQATGFFARFAASASCRLDSILNSGSRKFTCNDPEYNVLVGTKCYKVTRKNDVPSCGAKCPALLEPSLEMDGCSVPKAVWTAAEAISGGDKNVMSRLIAPCNRHDMCYRCIDSLSPKPGSETSAGSWANFLACDDKLIEGWHEACLQFHPRTESWQRFTCFKIARFFSECLEKPRLLGKTRLNPFYAAWLDKKAWNLKCPESWRVFIEKSFTIPGIGR